jgi:hypothetical protein
MCERLSRTTVLLLVLGLAAGAWADLVGHWKLDEGSGTLAKDATGNGNNGTLEGVPLWVEGMLGRALQFTGDDRVNCGEAANLGLTQGLSIALWVNPADFTGDRAFAGRSAANVGYAFKSNSTHLRLTTPGVRDHDGGSSILQLNVWQHVAVTFAPGQATGCVFYINGVATDTVSASALVAGAGPFEIGHNHWAQWCVGMIDDVQVYNHVLTAQEVMDAMHGAGPELAGEPNPEDEATDVPADAVLTWTPGELAATHDVYLGASFADVNTASRANPGTALVSQDQADAQYDPDRLLAYGQTYYWRIDEVNAAPDNTLFKGPVWSFTAEPYSYPVTPVAVKASSSGNGMNPENTINGSGLNAEDGHSTEPTHMWTSGSPKPHWIQYEFDKAYKLDKLLVWNSNQAIETFLGFGAKTVTIEYSADGTTWTPLEGVPEFARAPGAPDYKANTTVDFGGVTAKFVKLTITANWGGIAQQTGLSEVRFYSVPVQAREPQPADGATDVALAASMNWRPGREAKSHEVYFGADQAAVADGSASAKTVADHSYTPDPMNLGATYYWRVDEAGDSGTYPGGLWSFTVQNFAVVDDMESYTDDEGSRVYEAWIDGVTTGKSGSQVGYMQAPFAEKTIVRSGQSMPITYDNTGTTTAEATIALDQNWTISGIKSLSLYFRGAAGNEGQLYLKINNAKVPYDGPAGDIAAAQWLPWNIDLSAVSTNLSKVTSLTLGVEGAGAAGILYIDDIRLYPRAPEFIVPAQPAATGLVAQYKFDGDLRDAVGSNHGTASGDAKIVSDPARGQVLSVDGSGDKVDIAYNAALNSETFTVGLWARPTSGGTDYRSPISSRDDLPQKGYILYITPTNVWEFWTGDGTGTGWNGTAGSVAQFDEWSHVTATFAGGQKQLYINGRLAGQGEATLSPNAQRPLRIGAGATESAAGNYFFQGLIDDVRLYNRTLSAEEIAGLAGQTKPLHKPF